MRPDMYKVVTERPRAGGHVKPKGRHRNTDFADLPSKEGIRKPWVTGGIAKEFTDLLGPLQRFLRKNVGRPWNDIYSEIVSTLPNGLTARHILQHVSWEVDENVIMGGPKGKIPCYGARSPYLNGKPLRPDSLYVHPKTGVLCKTREKKPVYRASVS